MTHPSHPHQPRPPEGDPGPMLAVAPHRLATSRGNGHRCATDRGVTLIEIIVTITLLGLIVVPILVATAGVTKSSSTSRAAAQVESALINAVDRVNRAPIGECDYTRFARAAALSQGWDASQVTVSNSYLDEHSFTWMVGPSTGSACPTDGYRPRLVQLVTISITSPQGEITRSIEVVKSDV